MNYFFCAGRAVWGILVTSPFHRAGWQRRRYKRLAPRRRPTPPPPPPRPSPPPPPPPPPSRTRTGPPRRSAR